MQLDSIHHADLLTLCGMCDPCSVDMILCDLPYGSLEVGWDSIIPFAPMWEQFNRVIKPDGAIVLTAKPPFSAALLVSNPTMYRYSWYWHKARGANVAQTAYRPLAVIEEILVFSQAPAVYSNVQTMRYFPQKEPLDRPYSRTVKESHARVINNSVSAPLRNPEQGIGTHDYTHATPRNLLRFGDDTDRGLHPTQKPVPLFEYLIRTYTAEGETVLDPCVGSGTTAIAARNANRRYIVGDNDQKYVDVARKRIAAPFTLSLF